MNNDLFRKESLNNISSPEQLNDYIKVSNPSIWLILISICILLISFLVWCFVGNIPTTIDANAVIINNQIICYLDSEEASKVKSGMNVSTSNGLNGVVESIDTIPLSSNEVANQIKSDYIYKYLCTSEWNIKVTISISDNNSTINNELISISITTDTVKPISFLFN